MKRMIIFPVLFVGGFFYLFLSLLNMGLELENSRLREKKMLLERDNSLMELDLSKSFSVEKLEIIAPLTKRLPVYYAKEELLDKSFQEARNVSPQETTSLFSLFPRGLTNGQSRD